MSDLFYLQDSRGYVGNAISWWREGGRGYTCNLAEAGVFTREEAFKLHRNRSTDLPWPKEYIDQHARLTVDMQGLDRAKAMAEVEP